MNKPLITIITVCYNAISSIEKTILSVINQTYPNIEYIIIDGGSTDGTIDIIKKYEDKTTYWISEPDKGIYDAMNKGIKLATGEWINFMNCGDTFYSKTSISEVFQKANLESDIIYGNTNLLLSTGEYIQRGKVVTNLEYMPFVHQSSFSRSYLMKKYGFDTKYKICADKNFFYTIYQNKNKFEYVDVNISNYEGENGFSAVNAVNMFREIGRIENKDQTLSWRINFTIFKYIYFLKSYIKSILPQKLVLSIRKYNSK